MRYKLSKTGNRLRLFVDAHGNTAKNELATVAHMVMLEIRKHAAGAGARGRKVDGGFEIEFIEIFGKGSREEREALRKSRIDRHGQILRKLIRQRPNWAEIVD